MLPLIDLTTAPGALYLIEGSTLGDRVSARHLRQEHIIPPDAFRYFEIYGAHADEMGRIVCRVLDTIDDPDEANRSVRTAIATFGIAHAWMEPAQWRVPSRSILRMVGATGFEPVTPTMSR